MGPDLRLAPGSVPCPVQGLEPGPAEDTASSVEFRAVLEGPGTPVRACSLPVTPSGGESGQETRCSFHKGSDVSFM